MIAPSGPVLQSESAGGNNPSELNDTQPAAVLPEASGTGLSTNAATAELDVNATDTSVPGRGPALELDRTYSSFETDNLGAFGYGWSDAYAMSVEPDPVLGSSVADVHQENGSVVYFLENAAGSWVTASRVHATLAQSESDWVFVRDAKETFTFNSSGQLISEQNLNGYETTLSYTGGNFRRSPIQPGERSRSPTGRDGLVSEVTDPSGNTLTYGYDGNDNLSTVANTAGTTTYAYNAAHLLTSVENPNSQTTALTEDAAGRILSETETNSEGSPVTWNWSNDLDPFDSGTSTMTDPSGS